MFKLGKNNVVMLVKDGREFDKFEDIYNLVHNNEVENKGPNDWMYKESILSYGRKFDISKKEERVEYMAYTYVPYINFEDEEDLVDVYLFVGKSGKIIYSLTEFEVYELLDEEE